MAKRGSARGGYREGAGRKSLFPDKAVKVSVLITETAREIVRDTAARLTAQKPRISTAKDVDQVTTSDAVEFLIRKGSQTPLED